MVSLPEYQLSIPEVGSLYLYITHPGIYGVAFPESQMRLILREKTAQINLVDSKPAKALENSFQEFSSLFTKQIAEYLAGMRKSFSLPLDLRCFNGRKGQVQQDLLQIPYGQTMSYSEFARLVGNPRAVRFVSSMVAQNPLPFIYPCHRVIRSSGKPGEYQGGQGLKYRLIELEKQLKPLIN